MSEEELTHFDHYRRAKSHEKSGRYEEALKAYNTALEINREYAHAWYYKGKLHYQLGHYSECVECAEKALKLAPDWADHCNKMLADAKSRIAS
ncbi:MAG: tetratricopeptide repeat protein [Candidatus Thorarchaeota archaeon]|nr:tetratricopeptide repeat protein [Candidatus Thorarchaeota archaeon]